MLGTLVSRGQQAHALLKGLPGKNFFFLQVVSDDVWHGDPSAHFLPLPFCAQSFFFFLGSQSRATLEQLHSSLAAETLIQTRLQVDIHFGRAGLHTA